jgi:hypothetical protein
MSCSLLSPLSTCHQAFRYVPVGGYIVPVRDVFVRDV